MRRKSDFDRVYNEGKRVVSPFFVAFVLPKADGPLRVGVVASRKVGGAVARNRAKRLLREAFRRNRPQRDVAVDVVLVARGSIVRAPFRDVDVALARNVRRLLEKIP